MRMSSVAARSAEYCATIRNGPASVNSSGGSRRWGLGMNEVWRARNYYELLEVRRDASPDDIKAAWRLQQLAWNPDRFGQDRHKQQVAERAAAINLAYETLSDVGARASYDLSLPPIELDRPQFELPIMNVPAVWKRMAAWMRDEDVGEGFDRSMAFKTGDALERHRAISDRMRPWSLKTWQLAIDAGFDPESPDA